MDDTDLATRVGLPDAIRALLKDHPRDGWRAHAEFGPLTQFWLDKHMAFRDLLGRMTADMEARIDGRMAVEQHAPRLAQYGSHFLQGLHGHHSIEDAVYFPKMVAVRPELARAFDLLDADHHALHEALEGFANDANALLRGETEPGVMHDRLVAMHRFLDRHLTDEEDVVVPVILSVGEGRLG